ncbi:SAM-dependent methyltransferase, partial [bacterium]
MIPHAASFRDPSGFIYVQDGTIYRKINPSYEADYRKLIESGLHAELVETGLLIATEEVEPTILRPERIPTISYPYEWSFGQLKDAALLTLETMRRAIEKGMVLKDASAYNVQFLRGKPILIDTLSFENYREGEPWIAYRQFCAHFLAPLALMANVDIRLGSLLRDNIDGIPLDLAAKLLPFSTKLKPGLLAHIHVQGKTVNQKAEATTSQKAIFSLTALKGLIDSLK